MSNPTNWLFPAWELSNKKEAHDEDNLETDAHNDGYRRSERFSFRQFYDYQGCNE